MAQEPSARREDCVGLAPQGGARGLVGGLEPGPVRRVDVLDGRADAFQPWWEPALSLQVGQDDLLGVAVDAAEDAGEALPRHLLHVHPDPGAALAEIEAGVAAEFRGRNGQSGHLRPRANPLHPGEGTTEDDPGVRETTARPTANPRPRRRRLLGRERAARRFAAQPLQKRTRRFWRRCRGPLAAGIPPSRAAGASWCWAGT